MTMGEFSTLLAKLDNLTTKFEELSVSVAGCQALACAAANRRKGWVTWLSGAATTLAAVLLGFYLRR